MNDILQQNIAAERDYLANRGELDRQEKALRDEYIRVQAIDPAQERRERIQRFIETEATSARQSLRAAINAPNADEQLRELLPPALIALFPKEIENMLIGYVAADDSAKRARLEELDGEIQAVARRIQTLWEANRAATAPIR